MTGCKSHNVSLNDWWNCHPWDVFDSFARCQQVTKWWISWPFLEWSWWNNLSICDSFFPFPIRKWCDGSLTMYHLVTDEMVILEMSLFLLRNVNKSQSDGLVGHFLCGLDGITCQYVIHFSLYQSGKWCDESPTMYHLLTDETVILGMSLSRYRNVNKSQSDGLTVLFLAGIWGNNLSFGDLFFSTFTT